MKRLINFDNLLKLFLFILICLSFYLSLYYVFANYRDEIGYLSDSVLLAEGLRPSYSHAPSGLSTWFGTILIFFEYFINCLKNLSNININTFFSLFDFVLYKNYLDLTNIKLSLYILNILFLIYLFKISKSSNYFEYFIFVAVSPLLADITFSGKPYFLAYIFASLSLCFKSKKPYISVVFLALAVSERLEYLLLFNFIAAPNSKKIEYFKKTGILLLIFSAISPWFTMALLQNLKVIFGYIHLQPSEISSLINLNLNIIFFIILLLSIFLFPFIRNRIFKNIIIFLIILLFVLLSYYSNIPLRWFMPIIVIIIHLFIVNFNKISSYLIEKKIINILSIIFTLFFINSLSSKVSDLDILNKESKFLENSILIGPKTLKENGNFVNYSKFLKTYLYDYNAKNKYFFNEKDAPLVFGISGNLEILQNRRYEYLSKYHTKKNYSKFIMSDSGMYKDIKYYCSKFRSNTHYFNFKNYEYEKCNRIKK
tara:strand:+ start:381 stop:1829 length:1449 start_codon:yes stop_codon:yes gene_type:complete